MFKKILIIDDDIELSGELSDILRDHGHTVDAALFKRDNMQSFHPEQYDVIILDFKMQDLTGADILQAIPLSGNRPRVFLMTGRPFIEKTLGDNGLLNRVTEIIPKPFSVSALLLKISAA